MNEKKKHFPFRDIYTRSSLAAKIRVSYLILLTPVVVLLLFAIYNLWENNRRYSDMLDSVVVASEFSLDFRKDFDYETYLVIVENKTMEESLLGDLLGDASRVVTELEALTEGPENRKRLDGVRKYLNNLETYVGRIRENLELGDRYDDNIEIWENDVQIVTALIQDAVSEYMYYEIRDLQQSRESYQRTYFSLISYSLAAFVLIMILILILSVAIPRTITRPLRELMQVTDRVTGGDLTVRSEIRAGTEVNALSESMNAMIDEINTLLEQVKGEQIRLRKAEFQLLQSQINPHFLYNTLDAIIWLAEGGRQKEVVSMVRSLSEFFRTSLNQGKDIISLKEELQHARSYLEIQQVRYQDILQYEIQVPEELWKCRIPKISIQPLVENALYHGIKNKRGVGKITVTGLRQGDLAVIRVEDDGIGMDPERLEQVRQSLANHEPAEQNIYGLYNVSERIRLNFGENCGLSIESRYGEGTTVSICIPFVETEM